MVLNSAYTSGSQPFLKRGPLDREFKRPRLPEYDLKKFSRKKNVFHCSDGVTGVIIGVAREGGHRGTAPPTPFLTKLSLKCN